MLQNTATAGVTVTTLSPSPSLRQVLRQHFATVVVQMDVTGTYDATLALIKGLYDLPRLTSIDTLSITGGGPTTNRSTPLTTALELTAYTSAAPTGSHRLAAGDYKIQERAIE